MCNAAIRIGPTSTASTASSGVTYRRNSGASPGTSARCAKTRKFALEPVSDRELKFRVPLAGDSDLQAVSLTADVTGDGRPDLIFGSSEEQLEIYPALGAGEFASHPAETVDVRAAGVLEAVDLDGKGRADLILHYPKTRAHRSEIVVLTNRGG